MKTARDPHEPREAKKLICDLEMPEIQHLVTWIEAGKWISTTISDTERFVLFFRLEKPFIQTQSSGRVAKVKLIHEKSLQTWLLAGAATSLHRQYFSDLMCPSAGGINFSEVIP